jgi:hypothetical protein
MKKSVILLVALFLLGGISAQAQLKWGLKAGVNLSKISLDGAESNLFNDNVKNATGFQVGPMVEFTVPILGVGFDAAVLYSQAGFKMNLAEFNKTITTNNLQIPVNLKYKFSILNLIGAYAAAGPYANFQLSDNLPNQWKTQSFGAGLNFGVGVELLGHLQVGAAYQLGLTDDYKNSSAANLAMEAFKGKSRVWTVSAAYLF